MAKTEITGLPPQASMKAVKARAKAMGLSKRGHITFSKSTGKKFHDTVMPKDK